MRLNKLEKRSNFLAEHKIIIDEICREINTIVDLYNCEFEKIINDRAYLEILNIEYADCNIELEYINLEDYDDNLFFRGYDELLDPLCRCLSRLNAAINDNHPFKTFKTYNKHFIKILKTHNLTRYQYEIELLISKYYKIKEHYFHTFVTKDEILKGLRENYSPYFQSS